MNPDISARFGAATKGFPWHFVVPEQIRFHHCDPAGIAFFPRIDELLNATFEDWCAAIGFPFAELMNRDRCGFPLVHANINYTDVLKLGDAINIQQHFSGMGRSSITFELYIKSGERVCLTGRHTRVMTSLDTHRSVEIPDALRELLKEGTP